MIKKRLATNIKGLDEILHGGFLPNQTYLIRGGPGTGKTTLGLHFLAAGLAQGEKVLMITLGESPQQLRRNATSLGFDLVTMPILDLSPGSDFFSNVQSYDIFSPGEVEREPITQSIVDELERIQPQRVFIDSITQFRYLATDKFQFRKQMAAFSRFLKERNITTLFTSEYSEESPDGDVQFLCDGIININAQEGRTLQISKFRGSNFRKGDHALNLTDQGMQIFPKLVPSTSQSLRVMGLKPLSSGIPEIDMLLEGGIEPTTVSVITGPSGVGKTTLGMQFIKEAAGRGDRSVVYVFEEALETLLSRCEAVNIPVKAMMSRGTLRIVKMEPLAITAEEFANRVREDVEENDTRIVMLDSISGYRLCFKEGDLVRNLHNLAQYLRSMEITTIITNEIETITGDFRATESGISYLADNLVFLRYLELQGTIAKAIGVLKKRLSGFENTMREFAVTRYGIRVGEPLTNLRRILSGTPEFLEESPDKPKYK